MKSSSAIAAASNLAPRSRIFMRVRFDHARYDTIIWMS